MSGKIVKLPISTSQLIAEMELEKLYQKSLGGELTLEDTKKYDILVRALRESQKDSTKELEGRYQDLKQQMLNALPTEALEEIASYNPGNTEYDAPKPDESDKESSGTE